MVMTTGYAPIFVNRWQPQLITIAITGYDFTGGTFAMSVRLYRDATGSALLSLTNQTAGTEGISLVVTTDGDGIPTSTFTVQVDKATLSALLPFTVTDGAPNRKPGSDLSLVYDLHLTGTGLPEHRWQEGPFNIIAGVQQ